MSQSFAEALKKLRGMYPQKFIWEEPVARGEGINKAIIHNEVDGVLVALSAFAPVQNPAPEVTEGEFRNAQSLLENLIAGDCKNYEELRKKLEISVKQKLSASEGIAWKSEWSFFTRRGICAHKGQISDNAKEMVLDLIRGSQLQDVFAKLASEKNEVRQFNSVGFEPILSLPDGVKGGLSEMAGALSEILQNQRISIQQPGTGRGEYEILKVIWETQGAGGSLQIQIKGFEVKPHWNPRFSKTNLETWFAAVLGKDYAKVSVKINPGRRIFYAVYTDGEEMEVFEFKNLGMQKVVKKILEEAQRKISEAPLRGY